MQGAKRESFLFFWLAAGVAFATVAANRLFAAGIVSYEALYQSVTRGWDSLEGAGTGNLSFVLRFQIRIFLVRAVQTAVIFWVCRSSLRSLGISALLFMAGFSAGAALVLFTWCRGWFGLICFLLSGFPQEGCYLAAWGLMIIRYGLSVEVRPGRFWGAVAAFLLAGLFLEWKINPIIVSFL